MRPRHFYHALVYQIWSAITLPLLWWLLIQSKTMYEAALWFTVGAVNLPFRVMVLVRNR